MKTGLVSKAMATLAITGLLVSPAMARKASDMRDIIGLQSGPATNVINQRDFTYIEGHEDRRDRKHTYWWHDDSDHCIHVTSLSGVVIDVDDASDRDCNRSGGNGGTAAAVVGVAAGVGLLAALLSKKHHRDDGEYEGQDLAEFDRGFRDGVHHSQYHNYNRSDAYSDGYTKGSEQREANLQQSYNGAGYTQVARFTDLNGARASSADSTLGQRGFVNVDGLTSGNTKYTVWWQPQTRQCVQMTVANGRVANINDIRTHPKCNSGSGTSYGNASAPAQFTDVIGMRGRQSRDVLDRRGFERVARFGDDNTRYSVMWRAASRQCLQLMIVDNIARDIRDIQTHPNCR